MENDTVDGSEIRRSPVDLVKYPVIYRVSYMLGGAGFFHQQYLNESSYI